MRRAVLTSLAVGALTIVLVGVLAHPARWSAGANYALLAGIVALAVVVGVLQLPPARSTLTGRRVRSPSTHRQTPA